MNKTPKASTLDVFQKTFFPKFELLNSGCGFSVGAAYLRVFTVSCKALGALIFTLILIPIIRLAKTLNV